MFNEDDNNDFDGPSHLEKNDRRRKPRKGKRAEAVDGDRFSKKGGKKPYDKSQRRQRFDY